ncbi:hypothetical protein V2J09_002210 [Rumex salicifolius]
MREGLRSSTVSQRSSTDTQRRRDRTDCRNEVKLASDVGLAGNCNKVRNILPDLNTVANPSEFDSDWPFEGGYADDGETNGTLAENDVEGFVLDESIKPKEIATGCEGEIGKDLMQSYLVKKQKFEQEVHGELRNSGAKMIDINVDALECDESTFSDFCAAGAGEEDMVLEKDKIGTVDQISQQNIVSNLGCAAAACTEHYGPSETNMGNYNIDLNVGDDSSDLHSKLVLSGSCSENVTSTMDSPGDMDIVSHKANALEKDKLQVVVKVLRSRVVGSGWLSENVTSSMGSPGDKLDTIDQKTSSPEEDKLQAGGRVLRSRVVGLGLCSENVTCSSGSPGDMLDTVNQKTSSQDEDKLQVGGKVLRSRVVGSGLCSENVTCSSPGDRLDTVNQMTSSPEKVGGKVLRSRVVVAVTREEHTAGCNRRKRATGCQLNESETRNDESKLHFDGQNKKHKGIPGTLLEEENILLKTVLHGEEVFVEELKNDESNEFFEGQNKMDDDCLESLREKEVNADPLNNMIEKDETAAKELSNDISKVLVVVPKKKVGRGRPRKQHGDNVSASLLLKNIEIPLENEIEEGNSQLTDHIDKQQKGEVKKRKRGRPKKIDKEMDRKNLNQHDWEGTDKAGERMKKWGSRKLAEVTKNPRRKDQVINSLNSVLHVDEAELKGELKIKKGKNNKGADAADNKLRLGGLMKRKRGRPRKINMENDAPEPIPENQEGAVMVKEDTHHFAEGSVRRVKKLVGAQAEVNINFSGTAPLSSLRLKRKRESTGEEASKGESNLSTKDNLKVKNSSTREEKNVVRQQIVDMLKSAGWTVEYKPRQGKEYADSVYRSPVGKTYWSVTLAYRVLKQQVEMGKAANFCFTPIPDEKLSTLYRIQVKARSDKKKSKQNSSNVKSSGKCKGRKKMDTSEEKTANPLSKRKPSSVKSGKQNRRRCALLVRGSGLGINSAEEKFMAISGKHSILSWMIECGVIPSGGKVHYRRRAKVLLEGSITKDGILCSCCSKLYSVVQFEAHAGNRSCSMYQNLYLDNGSSLLQCQMESWNKQEESIRLGFHKVNVDDNDPNDDTCGICGDGGNLICCDGCPSTFHQACLNILNFPSGDWHCVYCSCKYCETTTGDVDQVNENHDISPVLLTCCLCDGKYHHLCAYEKEGQCGQFSGSAFCGKTCEQIYERFQRLVGVKAEVGDGYTCTFIKRPESQDITSRSDVEPKEIENMSKLAIALSVMDECFLPITDHRSGVNLMRHTLYSCGSNFKRLNFRGFFTAILEKEDEIIAAASIRIHGKELAEMPFIGTRNAYRRQGMCRRLLSGIESALSSLAIEKLVIPAVSEVTETWTSVFGFEPLGGLDSEMRHMNIIVFPGVDMLQKPLDQQVVDETTSDREKKDIKFGDCCNKKHADENGLIESKAEDGCISENCKPSIEPLQDLENGSHVPLEFATVDQEEGSNTERISSDTNHTTEENNQLTPTKDEGSPDGASDHMVSFSDKPVLVERLSLTENDACEDIDETFKSGTTGLTVYEDHISRLVEGGPDDTALNECEDVANKSDVTVQPNSSNECLKLEAEVLNPLESGAADPSLNSLCNCYLPTSVNDVNHPVEETHDSTRPVVQELQVQSSATEEKFLFVTDRSILNGAEVIAKTLEEGSNTERVSSDTTEEASDHMISSSEKPVMVENLSFAENDACEEVLSTVFEDHVSRLVKDEHDDTALKGCEGVANKVDDHSLADVRVQPNSSIDHPKLEVQAINPLENGATDRSSNLLCNSDLPSNVNDVYNPVEDINDSAAKENLLLVTDHSVSNVAQVTAKTPEHLSDLQNDCNIVTQFNLEKSCNMDSGSNDLGTPVTFHACSAPEDVLILKTYDLTNTRSDPNRHYAIPGREEMMLSKAVSLVILQNVDAGRLNRELRKGWTNQGMQVANSSFLLYKNKISFTPYFFPIHSAFLLVSAAFGHCNHQIAVRVSRGRQLRPSGRREAESPRIEPELELIGDRLPRSDNDLRHARVDLDGISADVASDIGVGDGESQKFVGFLNGNVGVGTEGKLENLGEEVR